MTEEERARQWLVTNLGTVRDTWVKSLAEEFRGVHERACRAAMGCGGSCWLPANHAGPHLCIGDTDGPDSCPA